MVDGHLVELDRGWALWRLAALRSAGLPIERLLTPARRGDGPRRVATQLGWYLAVATAGRLLALLRRGR